MSRAERIKELADAMYEAAQYLSTDASRLRKTMEDYHRYIVYEYSGEKDLELTWEDVRTLFKIADNYEDDAIEKPPYLSQEYCEEVLRRFNEYKSK